jgi:hypothetical protein
VPWADAPLAPSVRAAAAHLAAACVQKQAGTCQCHWAPLALLSQAAMVITAVCCLAMCICEWLARGSAVAQVSGCFYLREYA